jgi:CRP-like cAMP-binding protein
MSKSQARDLAALAAQLAETPADLGGWLSVAAALAAAGERKHAGLAFAKLGDAANALGQVALAVACARLLVQHKQPKQAATLVDAIGARHCHGSKVLDWKARPTPPAKATGAAIDVGTPTLEQAVASAMEAIDAAAKHAADRTPTSLAPTPLVHVLTTADFRALVDVVQVRKRGAGNVVMEVGQPARALFWIARGAVDVTRGEHQLGELRSGAFFGEIALVGGTTRTAQVTCQEDTWLLEIPAADVEKLAVRQPKLAKVLAEYARARLLANVMRTSELFLRLDETERKQLLERFSTRMIEPGAKLIANGVPNDTLFVLVSGQAEVRDGSAVIASLAPGDGVGEMSLLSRQPAVADVVATEAVAVLTLSRADFDQVAVKHPGLLAEVYRVKVEREQVNTEAVIHDAEDLIV